MDSDSITAIVGIVAGAVVAVGALYAGFRAGVKRMGEAIPGEDVFERLDKTLSEKVDPIMDAIEDGVDKLNPRTNGGAGFSKDDPAATDG